MHTLTSIYDAPTLKVMEVIQSREELSVTTDTSLRMESYMTVTFIEEKQKLQSLVLETKQEEEACTGKKNIASLLSEVADAFGISGAKRVSVVSDNVAYMELSICMETLQESDEWADMSGELGNPLGGGLGELWGVARHNSAHLN